MTGSTAQEIQLVRQKQESFLVERGCLRARVKTQCDSTDSGCGDTKLIDSNAFHFNQVVDHGGIRKIAVETICDKNNHHSHAAHTPIHEPGKCHMIQTKFVEE